MEEGDREPRLSGRHTLLAAACAALAFALGIHLLFAWMQSAASASDDLIVLSIAYLIGVPVAASSLAVWLGDPKGKASWVEHARLGALVVAMMCGAGMLLLGEGAVCVVMAAPIFLPAGIAGAIMTGGVCRWRSGRLYASALPLLPLLLLSAEPRLEPEWRSEEVRDSIVIDAAPSQVWTHLLEVRDIAPRELGWTFTQDLVGVPKPIDARLQGRGEGAVRHVRWGGGIRFREEIVGWEEERALAWRFRFDPDSVPESIEAHIRVDGPHLAIESGSYRLEPLPGGSTRLHLATNYRFRAPLSGYSACWGRIMIGDFHANVLRVIAGRAEGRPD